MNKIFGENGILYRGINRIVDLIVLNVIFVLTCLPVITIGSACVSMYQLTIKMIKNEESYIVQSYVKGIKDNFKKSTIFWGCLLILLIVLSVDFFIVCSFAKPIRQILLTLLISVFLILMMVVSYVFPLMAKFENSLKNTLKNAFIISMSKIAHTVVIVGINVLPVIMFFCVEKMRIYIINYYVILGFSLSAYINSYFLRDVFKKVFDIEV